MIRLSGFLSGAAGVGSTCRFYPSCSLYAEEAISQKGAWRGSCLSLGRLFRCHPFSSGGWEPVR